MKVFIGVKVIRAAKIEKIELLDNNKAQLTFVGGEAITVSSAYIEKHKPKRHGYYVKYPDGYASFSPAKAFEGAYREIGDAEASVIVDDFIEKSGVSSDE